MFQSTRMSISTWMKCNTISSGMLNCGTSGLHSSADTLCIKMKTAKKKAATRTDENTVAENDEGAIQDDCCHRNYDLQSSLVGVGEDLKCAADVRVKIASANRRHNRDFCVARQAFLEPCGEKRDAFYEQRLLHGLPWHCYKKPLTAKSNTKNAAQWFSKLLLPTHKTVSAGSV